MENGSKKDGEVAVLFFGGVRFSWLTTALRSVGTLADPGQVIGRESDGPKVMYGEFELEGGEEASFLVALDAQDSGGDKFGAAIVVQHYALAGVKFHADIEQSAVGIHNLGFDFDANATAAGEPRSHFQRYA